MGALAEKQQDAARKSIARKDMPPSKQIPYVNGVSPASMKKFANFVFNHSVLSVKPDERMNDLVIVLQTDFPEDLKNRFETEFMVKIKTIV